MTRDELSDALVNALQALPPDSSILKKLCDHFLAEGVLNKYLDQEIESLEENSEQIQKRLMERTAIY